MKMLSFAARLEPRSKWTLYGGLATVWVTAGLLLTFAVSAWAGAPIPGTPQVYYCEQNVNAQSVCGESAVGDFVVNHAYAPGSSLTHPVLGSVCEMTYRKDIRGQISDRCGNLDYVSSGVDDLSAYYGNDTLIGDVFNDNIAVPQVLLGHAYTDVQSLPGTNPPSVIIPA